MVSEGDEPETPRASPVVPYSQVVFAVLLYLAFVFFTIFSAHNPGFCILMMVTGTLNVLLESKNVVDRSFRKESLGEPLMLELFVVLRVVATSLVPMILVTFGGASFFALAQFGAVAEGCSVAQLADLEQGGYTSYACHDGYIPVDRQESLKAWELHGEGRRLRSDSGLGDPKEWDNRGFVAPIYTSHQDYIESKEPVAWAVKAGGPVRRSVCNNGGRGTCGMFVPPLKKFMSGFPATQNFGKSWGFSITRFGRAEMEEAVDRLRESTNSIGLGPRGDYSTFVIAEGTEQYFGIAYPLFWVTGTLLAVGLVDRLPGLFEAREDEEEEEEAGPSYTAGKEMSYQRARGATTEENGLLDEVNLFWNDPFNSSKLNALTDSLHRPEDGEDEDEDPQIVPQRMQMPPLVAGIRGPGVQGFQPSSARYSALLQS